MKKWISVLILALAAYSLYSQCDTSRYVQPVFFNIDIEEDVEYGEAPQWSFPYVSESLLMDIYQPQDDEVEKRPCFIWAHPGGFVLGNKQADDMVAFCDSLAHRGYVSATIGYRKGFNPLDASSSERAVYRGHQDGRAAYRFLVENHEEYGIDTTKIFFGGSSAGALIAHHVAFMEEDERPESTFSQTLAPDLECLDCTGNEFSHVVKPLGIVGLWGAIGDTTWIDSEVPTLMIHGTEDAVVPYDVGPPFEFPTLPDVYGSAAIHERLLGQGFSSQLISVNGEGHEPHGTSNGDWADEPTEFWYEMFDYVEQFAFDLIRPEPSEITGPEVICAGEYDIFNVELDDGNSVCWSVEGGLYQELPDGEIAVQIEGESAIISAVILNENGAASTYSSFQIFSSEISDIAWDYGLDGSILGFSVLTALRTQWYLNGDLVGTDNVGFVNMEQEGENTITLIIYNEEGCSLTYSETFLWSANGIAEMEESGIEVQYTENGISIFSEASTTIRVHDVSGKLICHEEISGSQNIYLQSGIYILTEEDRDSRMALKICIQ